MKTYKVTYTPISGDLRVLDKLSLFELAALLDRLQWSKYVSQETIVITTEEKKQSYVIPDISIPPMSIISL